MAGLPFLLPAGAFSQSFGSLWVKTVPRGAEILINGRNVGKSPIILEGVGTGTVRVKARYESYRPWGRSVKVEPDSRSKVVLILAKDPTWRAQDTTSANVLAKKQEKTTPPQPKPGPEVARKRLSPEPEQKKEKTPPPPVGITVKQLTPVTETKPVPLSKAEPDPPKVQGKYLLSVGCFSSIRSAERRMAKLMKISLPAHRKSARRGKLQCVSVGPFTSRKAAQDAAQMARTKAGVRQTSIRKLR